MKLVVSVEIFVRTQFLSLSLLLLLLDRVVETLVGPLCPILVLLAARTCSLRRLGLGFRWLLLTLLKLLFFINILAFEFVCQIISLASFVVWVSLVTVFFSVFLRSCSLVLFRVVVVASITPSTPVASTAHPSTSKTTPIASSSTSPRRKLRRLVIEDLGNVMLDFHHRLWLLNVRSPAQFSFAFCHLHYERCAVAFSTELVFQI